MNNIEEYNEQAETILSDIDGLEKFLQSLEQALDKIPVLGEQLSEIPVMISLIRNYNNQEYLDIPKKSIIIMISSFLYLLSPVDLISDSIPVLGILDDIAVMSVCIKHVKKDIEKYELWRKEHHLSI